MKPEVRKRLREKKKNAGNLQERIEVIEAFLEEEYNI